jgi:hypothetical protein
MASMKGFQFLVILLFIVPRLSAQRLHVGLFGGPAAYTGDLVDKIFPKKVTNGAIGATLNYELKDQVMIRGGFTYAIVGGADRYGTDPELIVRNLNFETSLYEFSLLGEYYFLNLYDHRYSPYGFAGLAVYHFNPYTYYGNNNKIYLKPLSTEGQGLPGYPERKPYGLTQLALPFGAGMKFAITGFAYRWKLASGNCLRITWMM